MKHAYILILATLSIFSCSKKEIDEIIVEVPTAYSWSMSQHFLYNHKFQLNSYSTNEKLYLLGFGGLYEIYMDGQTERAYAYAQFYRSNSELKFPVNAKMYVSSASDNSITFTSTRNPVSGGKALVSIDMSKIDPDFSHFDFPGYLMSTCLGLTPNNIALVPYLVKGSGISKILLVKLIVSKNSIGDDAITIAETKVIDNSRNDNVQYIQTIGNFFYITYRQGTTERVSESGDIEVILPKKLFQIFMYKDALYGFSYDGVYKSPNGKDWVVQSGMKANATLDGLSSLRYHTLTDGTLIATYNSQLFEVDLTSTHFLVKELDNSGLESHKITSVAEFNKKVYLTTLSGVFYRDTEKFLTYKEEQKEQ